MKEIYREFPIAVHKIILKYEYNCDFLCKQIKEVRVVRNVRKRNSSGMFTRIVAFMNGTGSISFLRTVT